MRYRDSYGWSPYVTVAERRRQAARMVAKLGKKGRQVDPVVVEGRKISRTFWGKAWCDNLESYSDYENRLPRGRTYVRNGSVIDLQIEPGRVSALVSGSSIYEVDIGMKPAAKARWRALAEQCAGKIDSVVELLQGSLSGGVMEILASRDTGLFPSPREISLDCSCPDWAVMCKHVAAVLYGVGARLDHAPEMLFVLRKVDHMDLVAQASTAGALGEVRGAARGQVLDTGDLSEIFGIDLEEGGAAPAPKASSRSKRARKKATASTARKTKSAKKRGTKSSARKSRVKKTADKTVSSPRKATRSTKASRATTAPRATKAPKAAKASRATKASKATKASRGRPRQITARELVELGVPRTTFQNWVTSGALRRTDRRGVYLTTAVTEQRIEKTLGERRERRRRR